MARRQGPAEACRAGARVVTPEDVEPETAANSSRGISWLRTNPSITFACSTRGSVHFRSHAEVSLCCCTPAPDRRGLTSWLVRFLLRLFTPACPLEIDLPPLLPSQRLSKAARSSKADGPRNVDRSSKGAASDEGCKDEGRSSNGEVRACMFAAGPRPNHTHPSRGGKLTACAPTGCARMAACIWRVCT